MADDGDAHGHENISIPNDLYFDAERLIPSERTWKNICSSPDQFKSHSDTLIAHVNDLIEVAKQDVDSLTATFLKHDRFRNRFRFWILFITGLIAVLNLLYSAFTQVTSPADYLILTTGILAVVASFLSGLESHMNFDDSSRTARRYQASFHQLLQSLYDLRNIHSPANIADYVDFKQYCERLAFLSNAYGKLRSDYALELLNRKK